MCYCRSGPSLTADFNSKDIVQDLNRLLCLETGASSAGLRESTPHTLQLSLLTIPHCSFLSAQLGLSVAMDCLSAAIGYLEVSAECISCTMCDCCLLLSSCLTRPISQSIDCSKWTLLATSGWTALLLRPSVLRLFLVNLGAVV